MGDEGADVQHEGGGKPSRLEESRDFTQHIHRRVSITHWRDCGAGFDVASVRNKVP